MRPQNARITLALLFAVALSAIVADDEREAEALFDRAEELKYERKDNDAALKAYREVAEKYPGTTWAAHAQGMVAFLYYYRMKRYEDAVRTYETIIEKYPDSTHAMHAMFYVGYLCDHFLQNRERAFERYLTFYRAYHVLKKVEDPAGLRMATNRINVLGPTFAQKLPADLPPRGRVEITGYAKTSRFTVWFAAAEETRVLLDYDSKINWRSFRFRVTSGDRQAVGHLSLPVEGITPPLKVKENGKELGEIAKPGASLVFPGIQVNSTYTISGMQPKIEGAVEEGDTEDDDLDKLIEE